MKYEKEYTQEISFPLGGIGTGCIGLDGGGRLIDWEIFNRPAKGSINRYAHFAIKAIRDGKPITYVLQSDYQKQYIGPLLPNTFHRYGHGADAYLMCGFPHFRSSEFVGEFPMAAIRFTDPDFPAAVTLKAFNPMIPNDDKSSSLPAAFFEIEIENITEETLCFTPAFSVGNPFDCTANETVSEGRYTMVRMKHSGIDPEDVRYGDLTVATDCASARTQTYWYRGPWRDAVVSYWNDFNSVEPLKPREYDTDSRQGASAVATEVSTTPNGKRDTCTVAAELTVAPHEKKTVRFVLAWNVPNCYNYWSKTPECFHEDGTPKTWKNYYATLFADSTETATYALKNWQSLYDRTLLFKNTIHSSTLPLAIIDAATATMSVLKSPTVLRLEDGSFYGWEGVDEYVGSCEGTCQHVWNYAYALCFLFPRLERSIRDLEFQYSTDADGRMPFRLKLPIGRKMGDFRACLDGQMGSVIKTYREWKLSGDTEWLRSHWETVKRVLEYAWSESNPDRWDRDRDGVLEGRQHHTLDMELFGPSSWLESMYLCALKAAAEMAEFLGDVEKQKEYTELFQKGYEWTKENLFNGRYFIQKCDVTDPSVLAPYAKATEGYWNAETGQIKYQIVDGCAIDQMLGQWHADLLGLGNVLDPEQVSIALDSVMRYNFKESMRGHANPWRIFSINDEAGTVICEYPEGTDKPKIPIPYCEETMHGFEYAFAGLLCSRGRMENAVRVTKAVRDHYDGKKRNPWNEIECGSNYARSMASYAMIPILSGFSFDLPRGRIGFDPYTKNAPFHTIWSVDGAWGQVEVNGQSACISVYEGQITLCALTLPFLTSPHSLRIDGKETDFSFRDGTLYFEQAVISHQIEVK